jgi:hypothetical protein
MAFTVFYLGTYIVAAELVSSKKSKGEILVFRRGHGLAANTDNENPNGSKADAIAEVPDIPSIQKHTSIFHWRDVCFDITVNKEKKRILDHIDGWIKPGTVTALLVSPFTLTLSDADYLGALWCWQDHSSRRVGHSNNHWRSLWSCICQWQAARCVVPAQDWLRATI